MNKLVIFVVFIMLSVANAANTHAVADKTSGVASRIQVLGSGGATNIVLTSATVATINIVGAGWYTLAGKVGETITTVNGMASGTAGDIVVLTAKYASEDIVVLDGSNLKIGGNRTLDALSDTLTLIYNGSNWYEMGFVNND